MKLASRASRPRLTVGFLRILCNGLCTAQRFHVGREAQMCRIGCPDEPDSLALQRMSCAVQSVCFFWVTCYGTTTERPDHADFSAKPPVWNRGNGLH